MGSRSSRPAALTFEEARKKLKNEEFERLQISFRRYQVQDYLPFSVFKKEILSDDSPLEFSKFLFDAFGGSSRGITFKKLVCGLATIAKGDLAERIKFLFNIFSTDGEYINKEEIFQSIRLLENQNIMQCINRLFNENGVSCSRVSYDAFFKWVLLNKKSLVLTEWLLEYPLSLTSENSCRTLYQTLSGVTHLDEKDIMSIEKQYIYLVDNKIGKLAKEQFHHYVSPPVLDPLVDGLFSAFDENGDGQIDFKEMVCGISACCRGPKAERHKFVFKLFDRNRSGMLNIAELHFMIQQILLLKTENNVDVNKESDDEIQDIDEIVSSILKTAKLVGTDSGLTLDGFRIWSMQNQLLDHILIILYELCHVIFGLQPNSKQDEKSIIKNWKGREQRRGLKPGQIMYLVSTTWWKQWEKWVESEKTPSNLCRDSVSSKLTRTSALSSSLTSISDVTSPLEHLNGHISCNGAENCNNHSEGEDKTHLLNGEYEKAISLSNRSISCESGWESEPGSAVKEQGIYCKQMSSESRQIVARDSLPYFGAVVISAPSTTRSSLRSWSPCPRSLTPDDASVTEFRVCGKPGPIDNSDLVVSAPKLISLTYEGGILRPDCSLVEGEDFITLPESLWLAMTKWYRGGTPALPRAVVANPLTNEPEIEFFPTVITFCRHQQQPSLQRYRYSNHLPSFGTNFMFGASSYASGSQLTSPLNSTNLNQVLRTPMYTAAFSSMTRLGEVLKFLCRQLNLSAETVRLWVLSDIDENDLQLLDNESLSLKDHKVENGAKVLIEVRNNDLTWPEEIMGLVKNNQLTNDHQTCERGLTGLTNLGNTCFMNSALQCISNTQPLTQYFTRNVHLYELNKDNNLGMKGQIALQYANLIRDLWSGSTRVTAPLKLRWTVCKYAPTFNDFNQHDCQELLSFLLDGLHEDLNRVKQKSYTSLKDSSGRNDEIVAAEAWENHTRRNQSIIVDLFHGLLKSTVVCRVCKTASVTFDPFTFLSLPLPLDNIIFVQIVVIRLDGSVPVKYGLRLQDDILVIDMKKQLSNLCHILFSQLLILRLSSNSSIQEILQNDFRVKPYNNCILFAYELPEIENDAESTEKCTEETSTKDTRAASELNCLKPDAKLLIHRSLSSLQNQSKELVPELGHRRSNSMINDVSSGNSVSNNVVPSVPYYRCRFKGFTIGIQRRMEPSDVYFVSHNRYKPVIFGLPIILPADLDERTWSGRGLYDSVLRHVSRLVVAAPSQMSQINHALDGDETMYSEYPFELKVISQNGCLHCPRCPWFKFCTGCKVEPNDQLWNNLSDCFIAVDWDATALHLRYRNALEMQFEEHTSVKEAQKIHTEPITLDSCLKVFTQPEELKDRDNYYCSKCKTHCPAHKKLDIWKLPPILIFQFKRFQNVNDRWVKSCKSVNFPRFVFDPSQYLAKNEAHFEPNLTSPLNPKFCSMDCQNCAECKSTSPNENPTISLDFNETPSKKLDLSTADVPENESKFSANVSDANSMPTVLKCGEHKHRLKSSCDQSDLQYDLYAISCHAGMLGAGHYVAYARNMNGKWYLYNDSSCKEIDPNDIDTSLVYILFYERRGLDYGKYIPDLADKLPYNADAADREIESEVRRMCCLQ